MNKRNMQATHDKKEMGHITVGNGNWEFKSPSWLAIALLTLVIGMLSAWGTFMTNAAMTHITKEDLKEYVRNEDLLRMELKIVEEIRSLERCFTVGPCLKQ